MSRGGGGSDKLSVVDLSVFEMLKGKRNVDSNSFTVEVMRLNVGGSFYTTTKPTLQAVQGSVLFRIASGAQYCPRDDRGNYVIDRDGHCFRFVLNYLRTSKLIIPVGYRELDLLREEADYYGLHDLVTQVENVLEARRKKARGRRWNGAAKKLSASVGENLHLLQEELTDDFFEDSWIV